MDAKCPKCDKVAQLDDEVTKVECSHCGFKASYDEYLDLMRQIVGEMAENFHIDRPGFN